MSPILLWLSEIQPVFADGCAGVLGIFRFGIVQPFANVDFAIDSRQSRMWKKWHELGRMPGARPSANHRPTRESYVNRGGRHVPYEIKRVYYLYDVPGGAERGGH